MLRHDLRVDPAEAEEVVRLAAERHAASVHDGPTVGGLAEALGLPEAEVERLLADVRNRRVPASERRFGDRSAAISAAIVLALFLVVGLFGGGYMMFARQQAAEREGMTITGPDGGTIRFGPSGGVIDSPPDFPVVMPPPTPESPTIDVHAEAEAREAIEDMRRELASESSRAELLAKKLEIEERVRQFKSEYGKAP